MLGNHNRVRVDTTMTNEEEITFVYLTRILKDFAEAKTCYDISSQYEYPPHKWDIFKDGVEYGEILLARTLLERIGVEFEDPSMRIVKND